MEEKIDTGGTIRDSGAKPDVTLMPEYSMYPNRENVGVIDDYVRYRHKRNIAEILAVIVSFTIGVLLYMLPYSTTVIPPSLIWAVIIVFLSILLLLAIKSIHSSLIRKREWESADARHWSIGRSAVEVFTIASLLALLAFVFYIFVIQPSTQLTAQLFGFVLLFTLMFVVVSLLPVFIFGVKIPTHWRLKSRKPAPPTCDFCGASIPEEGVRCSACGREQLEEIIGKRNWTDMDARIGGQALQNVKDVEKSRLPDFTTVYVKNEYDYSPSADGYLTPPKYERLNVVEILVSICILFAFVFLLSWLILAAS